MYISTMDEFYQHL